MLMMMMTIAIKIIDNDLPVNESKNKFIADLMFGVLIPTSLKNRERERDISHGTECVRPGFRFRAGDCGGDNNIYTKHSNI